MDLSSGILTLGSISSWKHEAVLSGDHFLFLKKNKKIRNCENYLIFPKLFGIGKKGGEISSNTLF